MWQLTIKQTTKRKYENTEYDHSEEVTFKSEHIETLTAIVREFSEMEGVGETSYTIEREVESNGTETV